MSIENEEHQYEIGDSITIANYNKRGIEINVIHGDEFIGKVHFNIVLLLSKHISGTFPINDANSVYAGTITISSPISDLSPQKVQKENKPSYHNTMKETKQPL